MTDEQRRQRQRALQLRIRQVAYMLWEASGRDHGRALDFWLAAEQEVLSEPFDDPEQPPKASAETHVEDGVSTESPGEGEGAEGYGREADTARR